MSIEAVRREQSGHFFRRNRDVRLGIREVAPEHGPVSITLQPIGHFTFTPRGERILAEAYFIGKTRILHRGKKFTRETGQIGKFRRTGDKNTLTRYEPVRFVLVDGDIIRFARGRTSWSLRYKKGALTAQEQIQHRLKELLGESPSKRRVTPKPSAELQSVSA
jgi:hypothetical protein